MRAAAFIAFYMAAPIVPAAAQQSDAAKLAPYYQQQRNAANDSIAACAIMASELQAKVAELEKKIAELMASSQGGTK